MTIDKEWSRTRRGVVTSPGAGPGPPGDPAGHVGPANPAPVKAVWPLRHGVTGFMGTYTEWAAEECSPKVRSCDGIGCSTVLDTKT